ncbi:hypothetical protein [Flavobacterium sp.]|jgi:hypothetical protein|uniref:hypothetical protein n=1 Tax=Flavobacterium sp. TaxID=239 RepID=UPI0022BF8153|nr:hypothetical protein [Flavobacterium sp.]MCZ8091085.1 hypothetical protein [Flavobacterium sp.]
MTFKQFYLFSLFGITFSIASYLFFLWLSHSNKNKQNSFYKEINQGLLFIIFAILSWSVVAIYKIFDLKEFTLSYIINDRILSSMNNLFLFLSLAFFPIKKKNRFTLYFVKKEKWVINVFIVFSLVISFFTITDKVSVSFNFISRLLIVGLDSIFSIVCLSAIGYILYQSCKELGFGKWMLTYITIVISMFSLTQILLPLSKMLPGALSLFYPYFLAFFIICLSQFVFLIATYYSVLYFSLTNKSSLENNIIKDKNTNSQEISEVLKVEIGYNQDKKLFYLTLTFIDEFQKEYTETNENSKLLQPLLYWMLFSYAKKQNVMLTHQDMAIAKFRMVDYWNKESDFKLTQELLFFNESGHFELKINGQNITINDMIFLKSKLSVKELFKKYFICFVPSDVKTAQQLYNKKNADKYLLEHFEGFYFNISE